MSRSSLTANRLMALGQPTRPMFLDTALATL